MKKSVMIFLVGLLMFSAVLAKSNDFKKICSEATTATKFVVKLNKSDIYQGGEAKLCALGDFQENGEACGGDGDWIEQSGINKLWLTPGGVAWRMIDLNGDKHFDLTLSLISGGIWMGSQGFKILASCGDNTYIEVLDDSFANFWTGTIDKKTGWVQLHAIRQYIREGLKSFGSETDDFNIQELGLKFDPETYRYRIIQEGKVRRMTGEDEDRLMEQSRVVEQRKPSFDLSHFVWDEFPASIPRKFAPSFDCAKAGTKVEKTICSTGGLSRLDKALAANYKQIVAENEDQRAQLTTEQRAWLKQRSTCYRDGDVNVNSYSATQCLFGAYIQRVDELCTKYPLKSGTCISSKEAMKTSGE